jgi:hypothetical protein
MENVEIYDKGATALLAAQDADHSDYSAGGASATGSGGSWAGWIGGSPKWTAIVWKPLNR